MLILTSEKPGISTTIVGEQMAAHLKTHGVEVDLVPVADKSGSPLPKVSGQSVLCLLEHKFSALMGGLRFSRPKSVVSVFLANFEAYTLPWQLSYLAHFKSGRFGGVPVAHVSHSKHTQMIVRQLLVEVYRPSFAQQISKGLRMIPFGIEDRFTPAEAPPNPLRMIAPMNRVNQSQKNVVLHAEVTRSLISYSATRNLTATADFYYASGFGPESKPELFFDRDVYTFIEQPANREEFVERAKSYGLFVSTSLFESFGLYYLELLASGVVGVFLDRPWIRSLLPNYPLIVQAHELKACAAHVVENYAKYRAQLVNEVAPAIRRDYALSRFAKEITVLFNEIEGSVS